MAEVEVHQRQVKALIALVFVCFCRQFDFFAKQYVHKPYNRKEEVCAECLVGSLSGVLRFLIAYLFRDNPVILMQYMVMPVALVS